MTSRAMVPNACPLCGGDIVPSDVLHDVHIGKRVASVRASSPRCDSCGEIFLSSDEAEVLQRRAADVIRHDEGLLSPSEIRAIREKLGLTQAQFETLIAAGPKTVVRWERGTVFQNGATDTLLRILDGLPSAVHFAAQLRGVPVTPFTRTHHIAARLNVDSSQPNYRYEETRINAGVTLTAPTSGAATAIDKTVAAVA